MDTKTLFSKQNFLLFILILLNLYLFNRYLQAATMVKAKKKATTQEKLAKDRLRKKEKYAEIKEDPEKYSVLKEKQRKDYLLRKAKKKILSIDDMTDRQKREQRRRWRTNSRKYKNKLKEQKRIQRVLLENSPPESGTEEIPIIADPTERDPLVNIKAPETVDTPEIVKNPKSTKGTSSALRKLRYRTCKALSNMQTEIDKLKKEKYELKKQLHKERKMRSLKKSIDDRT